MEEWRDIPNYEGLYQISDLGRVRSLERRVLSKEGRTRLVRARFLKPNKTPNGYLKVVLAKEGSRYTVLVHHLVGMVFMDYEPKGQDLVLDHKDADKLNNRKTNLQTIPNRDNVIKGTSRGVSKYVGVSWHSRDGVWQAKIWKEGRRKYLGSFDSEEAAHEAYQNELKNKGT